MTQKTGKEPTRRVILNIAKKGNLIPYDIDGFYLGEDGSLVLVEEYASRFTNIIVLSQENKGTSGARNTGIRRASGKYICFVDPDDYVLENSFRRIIDRMEEESLDVLRCELPYP